MLSNFPSRDVEEPATKDHLRAEFAIYRAEVQSEFGAVRAEVQEGLGSVRSEMQEGLGSLRSEMQSEFAAVRSDMGSLRVELHDALRSQTRWLVGAMVSISGVFAAVSAPAVAVAG